MRTKVTHHFSGLVPYYIDEQGELHFILEQKSDDYKHPYFHNGLAPLGGNWFKGKSPETSAEAVLIQELDEEFFLTEEHDEQVAWMPKAPKKEEPEVRGETKADAKTFRQIIGTNIKHSVNLLNRVAQHVSNLDKPFTVSVFTKKLSKEEYSTARTLLEKHRGKLSTDTIKHEGRIWIYSLKQLNEERIPFSFGYDHLLELLGKKERINMRDGIWRKFTLAELSYLNTPKDLETTSNGGPTFADLESAVEYDLHT